VNVLVIQPPTGTELLEAALPILQEHFLLPLLFPHHSLHKLIPQFLLPLQSLPLPQPQPSLPQLPQLSRPLPQQQPSLHQLPRPRPPQQQVPNPLRQMEPAQEQKASLAPAPPLETVALPLAGVVPRLLTVAVDANLDLVRAAPQLPRAPVRFPQMEVVVVPTSTLALVAPLAPVVRHLAGVAHPPPTAVQAVNLVSELAAPRARVVPFQQMEPAAEQTKSPV
jgi:hypothetical protein